MNMIWRKACVGLLVFLLASVAGMPVYATAIYDTYVYSNNGDIDFSPDVYAVEQVLYGRTLGVDAIVEPTDLCMDGEGNLYILDGGSNSLFIIDQEYNLKQHIRDIYRNGTASALNKPTGVTVGKNGKLYICDSGNRRIVCLDTEGNLLMEIQKPDSAYFPESVEFIPKKLELDSSNNIYVSCIGVSQGLVVFNEEGVFSGFYGAPKVETTLEVLSDYFWKLFMAQEAKDQMAAYVPPEVANLCITEEDFVGTITNSYYTLDNTKNEPDTLCLLNPMGIDVLPEIKNQTFIEEAVLLNFTDICIDEYGFMTLVDNHRGKIYQFDAHMNMIAAFGAAGNYEGTFESPVAIEAYKDKLYVLDEANGSLTVFRLTEYGEKIHRALVVYGSEKQDQAIEPWQDVLEMNANYDLAYVGIGNVLLNQGDYQKAMEYFRIGHDSVRFNEAFKRYRITFLRTHTAEILMGVVLLIVICRVAVYIKRKRHSVK